jgi:carbon monoxide dehydrogenase subunit G
MSAQLEITSRVLVAAEPARVWQVAMDWSRQREWIWATQVRGGAGTGAEVVARTGIGPAGFTDTMVITEWDPPRRCVVRHTGRVVRGEGVFEVVPDGAGSEFRWTERLDLPFGAAGRWGWRVARPLAQRGMDLSLRRFARFAGAGAPG